MINWETTVNFYQQFITCVEESDGIGAYYNLQLAMLSCKQYLIRHPTPTSAHRLVLKAPKSDDESDRPPPLTPEDALLHLLALLPKYRTIVKSFQRNFGCPDEGNDDSKESLTCEDAPIDIQKTVDKDNGKGVVLFNSLIGNEVPIASIKTTIIQPYIMPKLYPNLSRGILFYGPAGTGKTLLAKATAFELFTRQRHILNVLFYAPTAEKLKGKYLGETEKKITTMFQCASKQACETETKTKKDTLAILFIDEIDAIARSRDGGDDPSGVNASATNTLLQMMDGVSSFPNVIVISATNLPWNIDSAILRRFSSKIMVPLPDEKDVLKLLKFSVVHWIARVLYHDPTVFNPTKCPTFSWDTTFEHLRWIHGVKENELAAVAQMCHIGNYAPRDLKNLCQQVFIAQGSHARQAGGFHKIEWRASGEERDVPVTSSSYDPLSVCKLLQGKYLSAESYHLLLKENLPGLVKSSPYFPSNGAFPLQICYNTIKGTHFSIIQSLPSNLRRIASSMPETLNMYFDFIPTSKKTPFFLHKIFKIVENTNEITIPIILHGTLSESDVFALHSIISSWMDDPDENEDESETSVSIQCAHSLIKSYVHHIYMYHRANTFGIVTKQHQKQGGKTRNIRKEEFTQVQVKPYEITDVAPLRSADQIAKYIVERSNLASKLSTHQIEIHNTIPQVSTMVVDANQPDIMANCCNLTLDVNRFKEKMRVFPTGNTEKVIRELNEYRESGKIPTPDT
jgi:hypothetical protein